MDIVTLKQLQPQSVAGIGTIILEHTDENFVCKVTPAAYDYLASRAEAVALPPYGTYHAALRWSVEGVECCIVAEKGMGSGKNVTRASQ